MKDFSLDSQLVKQLDRDVMAFIARGVDNEDEPAFEALALREFEFQYHNNAFYRSLCEGQGVTPKSVSRWEDIPAVPARAFKENVITSIPLERATLQYMSSGTTNPTLKTKVYRDERCAEMVAESNKIATKAFLFPDVERLPVLLFVPSPEVAPFMGMAVGLTIMKESFGTPESRYLIGPEGLDTKSLYRTLLRAEETGEPVALIGATSGFVFFFNSLAQQNLRFQLPPGSRIADGGGYMGTFGDCSREEYLDKCAYFLGVSPDYCVNTLGMAESGQNFLDSVLREALRGRPGAVRHKPSLPWAKVIAVDPVTGQRVPRGQRGWLRHYDLTNRATVVAVQSDNIGYETETGFEILGRAKNAEEMPAGHQAAMRMMFGGGAVCSTVADQMLAEAHSGSCGTVAETMLSGQPCSTVSDQMLAEAHSGSCGTVAETMLSGHPCSTVADKMLAEAHSGSCGTVAETMLSGQPCSTVADQMLAQAHSGSCGTVAERMLAAGAPKFIVDMVQAKLARGEKIQHPFQTRVDQEKAQ